MSVLINMEMPTNCLSCPLQGGTADCRLTQKTYNWGLTERPSDCPLIPVPEHGDLIDRDAMIRDIQKAIIPSRYIKERNADMVEFLRLEDTIIPADDPKEE